MSYASSLLTKFGSYEASTSFLRNAGLLAGSTAVTQILFLILSPILTRVYSPEDFGMLGVFVSLLSISLPMTSLRYELAITLPQEDEIAINVLVLAIIILLGTTSFFGTGMWFFGDQIMKGLHVSFRWYFSYLLIGGLFASGLFQALNFWALRKKTFSRIARTKMAQGSVTAIGQIVLGLLHSGSIGLLVGDVVGRTAGIKVLAELLWTERSKLAGSITITQLLHVARRYKRFPYLSCGSGILNAMGLYIPVVLMASLYGAQATGFFSLAIRLTTLPISLLGQATGQVFWGEASRMCENPADFSKLFNRIVRTMFLIAMAIVVPVTLLAPSALATIFGEPWRESGYYIQLLSLGFVGAFVVNPLAVTLAALERQSWQLAWDAGRLALVIFVFISAYYLEFSAFLAALSYGVAQLVAYSGYIVLCATAIRLQRKKCEMATERSNQLLKLDGD